MSTILSIEASTRQISAALFDPHLDLQAEWTHIPDRRQPAALLSGILGLLDEHRITFDQIGCIAVGRGPGIYSGLRESLTAAQALALPSKIPLYPLNSGMILAADVLKRNKTSTVLVAGDARRSQFWYAQFSSTPSGVQQQQEWKLAAESELLDNAKACGFAVSSEWDRIQTACRENENTAALKCFVHENIYPSALTLAEIVYERMQRDTAPEKASPIYMHPAVAARPKKSFLTP